MLVMVVQLYRLTITHQTGSLKGVNLTLFIFYHSKLFKKSEYLNPVLDLCNQLWNLG